ncbi:MliC family protein [Pasteurella bettyae]|uniref:Putative opacity-associated protein OapB n=2 Tax=Pasteurella bettyae TaxID=752 RepID=I3DIV1_9PAST|nr:MliC family protein [Pasteurella bettyae]EIJ71644.1 putative opacity-associated protein OapB [Pasteurella bettyae CCUG 2042]
MKKAFLLLIPFMTVACTQIMNTMPENPKPIAKTNEVSDKSFQKGSAILYRCKDDKEVRIIRNIQNKKAKMGKQNRFSSINVTFNNITEKLTSTVSESGNSYTNIHWHWFERDDFNILTTSVGQVLAEQCIIANSSFSAHTATKQK